MSLKPSSTDVPAALGYRWPAEWEPQSAIWLSWPHNRNTWPGAFEVIPPLFARYVRTLATFEPVHICAGGTGVLSEGRSLVGDLANVTLHDVKTNDAWCRDHGPIFLTGPASLPPALIDWEYNAWGGKYPPFDKDNDVPRQIADIRGRRRFRPAMVLEGGAIDGNGHGTILTTESCLLNPNRNPSLTRDQIEQYLADFLGARHVLWLKGDHIAGDDTDGHIDQLARFVNASTVVAAHETDPTDENYASLAANFEQLQTMTDQDGQPLRIIPLPMPRPLFSSVSPKQRMPASYCNFQIVNGAVIVPQFDDPADRAALDVLVAVFPHHEVIGLSARELVWGLGAFHCLSQQEPAYSPHAPREERLEGDIEFRNKTFQD